MFISGIWVSILSGAGLGSGLGFFLTEMYALEQRTNALRVEVAELKKKLSTITDDVE